MNTVITSAKNPTVKWLRKLGSSAKIRREEGLLIAEGAHLVSSYLHSGQDGLRMYVCAESALQDEEVGSLARALDENDVERLVVSDELFKTIATIHPEVGIAIVCSTPNQMPIELLNRTSVLLDDVQDPGNLGTILRVSVAAGVQDVFLSAGAASAWSPKALRAGMGAQFGLNIYENVNLHDLVRTADIPVLVTTLSARSESLYDLDLKSPVVWIFGNEGQGVGSQLAELATTHVSIPQADTPVESLNVAAAVSVCLYEQYRQTNQAR